ncbi:transposase, partial [bacterium]|nr:transposase [bacterium]
MFKKSDKHKQLDAFSSPIEYLKDSTMNYYLKNDSWHNQFRQQVLMRVDESIFKALYTEITGAPNASIRVLVGMMILKEGQGWSDEQLFENCNFNLLVRSALGLMTLEDSVPVASTYYLFRR